jgi:site-specific recombinase XerD
LRKIQQSKLNDANSWLPSFLSNLQREDLSPATVRGYRYDLAHFHNWFTALTGSKNQLNKLTAFDLISYRQHLINVLALRPATVNRRLEALRRFCR